ncbi:MAG TPA: proton-conducting transporter membrane subunit [Myxococcota bacterium]|nr:proton-conducting transporter membrane subunit [Myxococcota bacterium]
MVNAIPLPLGLVLVATATIAASGLPGYARSPVDAASQRLATALGLLGSTLGALGLVLFVRAGEAQTAVFGELPIGRLAVSLDGLSALFLVPMLVVSALGSLYGSEYWHAAQAPGGGRRLRLCWGIMTAAMMGVVLARDAILFLVAWEAMALAAFFLIATEEERPEVRRAAWVYLVATHAGSLCLVAFFALLARATGSFDLWPSLPGDARGGLVTAVFALGIGGFGLKAGLVPLHVWLPGAHANAPSHVSALLSGVLLKTGVYGIVRVCGLLPEPPAWWGGALLGIGVLSAVLGMALAVAQQDLKRLLAYSSIENVGIIAIGVGLAAIGRSLGRADLVALGLGGALLHVLNHSVFKPLLFFVAGSVLHATGTRRLASLGGLARSMPRTFAAFALGAVAICGLPPLNGFASELLLYLGLLRAAAAVSPHALAWAGAAAPALALTGALTLAAFVKVAGIAFCGTARTPQAVHAHDPGHAMLAPMAAFALACVGVGLAPGLALSLLQPAIDAWQPALAGAGPSLSNLAPFARVSQIGVGVVVLVVLGSALSLWRARAGASVVTWDCGYARPTPRMQYVDSSFSEMLVGLFDWALRTRRSLPQASGLFPSESRFESEVPDAVLDRVVMPLLASADRKLLPVRALQRGPVQAYLLYVFLIVVVLLTVVR